MQELQKLKDKGFVALVGDFKKHRYSHPTTYVMQHKKSKLLYVGSTANLYKRLAQHRRLLRANIHKNPNLQKAYLEDPGFDIVYRKLKCVEDSLDLEQELLDYYHPLGKLFNIAICARASPKGIEVSEEMRQIRREITLKQFSSPEARKAHSELTKKMWQDPEYVRKQRNRVWGEKELNHLKMARSRIWTNPETAERLREHLNSPEHRERLRKASRKPIEINGVLYPSQKDAANALGICHKTLSARLKRERMKKNE